MAKKKPLKGGKQTAIRLTHEQYATALLLGDKNASKGVRLSLDQTQVTLLIQTHGDGVKSVSLVPVLDFGHYETQTLIIRCDDIAVQTAIWSWTRTLNLDPKLFRYQDLSSK